MKKIFILILLFPVFLYANNLEPHKKTCSDIGFTSGTEDYAQCVMDFFKKEKEKNQQTSNKKSNSGSSSKDIAAQNRLLKEQFEYQKRKDEKKDFQKTMDNLGNLIDSITGSGKYYQPSNNQTCYNYGTALHPNIHCN